MMHSHNVAQRMQWRRHFGWLTLLVVALLIECSASPAEAAVRGQPFDASYAGSFAITGDIGQSVLFVIEETGSGFAPTTLGNFSYASAVMQNLARVPDGCGSNSSTGVDGAAILTFSDGQVRLKRISGTSCFAFPTLHIEERWIITSGTGRYLGATGDIARVADGDVRSRVLRGTLSGLIQHDH